MSLASLYLEMYRNAARTGDDRALSLRGGARLALRVKDGQITLNIMRKGKPISATELETFRVMCSIPVAAQRYPADGQGEKEIDGQSWRYVAFRWLEEQ
jgi:hypothetical protein